MSVELPEIVRVHDTLTCCDSAWEEAYLRFETPQQEIAKFKRRLTRLGVAHWSRDARIVELFCGRGHALCAWEAFGFTRLEGVDLSEPLLRQFRGNARLYLCDARELPFESGSRDIVAVQGGLHHLQRLPEDLEQTLAGVARVLMPGGLLVAVEPWMTPFLRAVHFASEIGIVRRMPSNFDAFAMMTEREHQTYCGWMQKSDVVMKLLRKYFDPQTARLRLGKLEFVGRRRD